MVSSEIKDVNVGFNRKERKKKKRKKMRGGKGSKCMDSKQRDTTHSKLWPRRSAKTAVFPLSLP